MSYRGYGAIAVAQLTAISRMRFSPGDHYIELPSFAYAETEEDVLELIFAFRDHAMNMGWAVINATPTQYRKGWRGVIEFYVPVPGEEVFFPEEEKKGPGAGMIILGIGIGVTAIAGLLYFGSKASEPRRG